MIVGMKTNGSRVADVILYVFIFIFAMLCLLPVLYIFIGSITSEQEYLARTIVLFPRHPDFSAYSYLIQSKSLMKSIGISILVTVIGTFISLALSVLTAYPLSKQQLRGGKVLNFLVLFTMMFNGGMIPTYIVVNSLHLTNTLWSLWLPGAISVWNMIIIKNSLQQLPKEIEEAATIDGCNSVQTLVKIVLPLSLPVLATFTLFYAVSYWNNYFNAVIYINNSALWPIQVWLRQIILLSSGGLDQTAASDTVKSIAQNIQDGVIVFATVPVLIVYPFIQKYFTKGVLVGSVKG